jgi:biofilm PGA synthesis N-glycosyltransferase PgaC
MSDPAWTIKVLGGFVLAYPIVMSFVWMVGGVYSYVRRERGQAPVEQPPPFAAGPPPVTILIPCHNEGVTARETVEAALEQVYPGPLEVIAINDGSSDDTGAVLDDLAARHERVRVVHLETNQGKAVALRMGALAANSEYLVCVDGDALLDAYAAHWLVWHLTSGPRVGAVTGNPRIRNRSTLLGRLQVGEFSSIIGMIKRAQRTYGRVFTISGVIAGFRRTALHRIGYWSDTIITEDIDVSWRLQMDHWDVRYEPRALCSILMPETVRGLWKQRLRWAKGGAQTAIAHSPGLRTWRRRRMWPVLAEYLLSVTWAFAVAALALLMGLGAVLPLPEWAHADILHPSWATVMMTVVCLLQFGVSMMIDRRYEPGIGRTYYWMIWYPIAYWLLSLTTTLVAVPATIFGRRGQRALWTSPDRGVR